MSKDTASERPAEVELLPCPFCGGSAGTLQGDYYWDIGCLSLTCPMAQSWRNEVDAIAAWNTRAVLNSRNDVSPAACDCPECNRIDAMARRDKARANKEVKNG